MSRETKKQRQEVRRRESISPVKRLAEAEGEAECWISENFESNGQAQMFAYKRGAGLTGIACFLVDRGIVGLKDAWVRIGIDRLEFNEMLDACKAQNIPMHRTGIDDVRRLIAGGIRWAHDNGMRLPKDWVRPASLIGGVGDWASADVSAFVMEFAGHPEDLRQRLIGQSLETFLNRADIQFQFSESAPYMDQETGEYALPADSASFDDDLSEEEIESIADELPEEDVNLLAEKLDPVASALAVETADWLEAQNDRPSPELLEAWKSVLLASLLSKTAMPDAGEDEVADFGFELLRDLSGRIKEPHGAEYEHAVGQVLQHLQTDPMMMQKAVLKHGFGDPADDQTESR